MKKPKPDDRSDNVENLQNAIQHTQENYQEAKDYLKAHVDELSSTEQAQIEEKNQKRETAIRGYREEINDELANNKNEFK